MGRLSQVTTASFQTVVGNAEEEEAGGASGWTRAHDHTSRQVSAARGGPAGACLCASDGGCLTDGSGASFHWVITFMFL